MCFIEFVIDPSEMSTKKRNRTSSKMTLYRHILMVSDSHKNVPEGILLSLSRHAAGMSLPKSAALMLADSGARFSSLIHAQKKRPAGAFSVRA